MIQQIDKVQECIVRKISEYHQTLHNVSSSTSSPWKKFAKDPENERNQLLEELKKKDEGYVQLSLEKDLFEAENKALSQRASCISAENKQYQRTLRQNQDQILSLNYEIDALNHKLSFYPSPGQQGSAGDLSLLKEEKEILHKFTDDINLILQQDHNLNNSLLLREEYDRNMQQLVFLEERFAEVEERNEKLKQENSSLREKVKDYQTCHSDALILENALLSSNEQKDTMIQEFTEKLKEINEEVLKEKQQKSVLTQQFLESEKISQEMETQLQKAANDIKSMSEREKGYLENIGALEGVKIEKEQEISLLKDRVESLSSAVIAARNRDEVEPDKAIVSPMRKSNERSIDEYETTPPVNISSETVFTDHNKSSASNISTLATPTTPSTPSERQK
jgi:DNA repair exonuclease SbcCD ATPase subunit